MTIAADKNRVFADGTEPPMTGLAGSFESWPGPVIEVLRDGTVVQANKSGRDLVPSILVGENSSLR